MMQKTILATTAAATALLIGLIGCAGGLKDSGAGGAAAAPVSTNEENGGRGNAPRLKNVILMISDGCGYNHVEAAAFWRAGKAEAFAFQRFPVWLAMATYMEGGDYDPERAWASLDYVKNGYTDSGAASTAMATGHRTYKGAIGFVGKDAERAVSMQNVVECAETAGKATGVVTSVQFSHATPAGFVAHNRTRSDYAGIAREMLCESAVDVVMGCGHPAYDNDSRPAGKPDYKYVGGEETWQALCDGALETADADGDGAPDPWRLIETREDFLELAGETMPPARVCGVPMVRKTLQQERSGDAKAAPFETPVNDRVPTLAEMTRAALNVLDDDPDGLFLMVEGGAVDWASHDNQLGRMIEEEIDFADAVDAVIGWVEANDGWDRTLLVVTGDHECGCLAGPLQEGPVADMLRIRGDEHGRVPEATWRSDQHTNLLIPLYANGPSWALDETRRLAKSQDPVRGPYLDSATLGRLLMTLVY